MSSKGDSFASMESFFKTRRAELINQADCAVRAEARREVFAFATGRQPLLAARMAPVVRLSLPGQPLRRALQSK